MASIFLSRDFYSFPLCFSHHTALLSISSHSFSLPTLIRSISCSCNVSFALASLGLLQKNGVHQLFTNLTRHFVLKSFIYYLKLSISLAPMSYQPPPTPSDPQENTQANRASGSLQTTDLRPQQTHPHPLQYPPIYAGPSQPYISPYAQTSEGQPSLLPSAPESRPQYAPPPGPSSFNTISLGEASGPGYLAPAVPMSSYSSSSQEDSIYSSPGAQQYQVVTPGMLNDPRPITQVSPSLLYVNSAKSLLFITNILLSYNVFSVRTFPSASYVRVIFS